MYVPRMWSGIVLLWYIKKCHLFLNFSSRWCIVYTSLRDRCVVFECVLITCSYCVVVGASGFLIGTSWLQSPAAPERRSDQEKWYPWLPDLALSLSGWCKTYEALQGFLHLPCQAACSSCTHMRMSRVCISCTKLNLIESNRDYLLPCPMSM